MQIIGASRTTVYLYAREFLYIKTVLIMKMTNKQYQDLVEEKAPKSKTGKNVAFAFLIGGGICCAGQGLKNLYGYWHADEKVSGILVAVTLIFLAALLTCLHVYDNIAKVAGAGTLVPITGFSNAMVSPAIEFKSEGMVAGLAVRMFTIAGPVIVFGLCASVLYGVILVLFQVKV